MIPAWTMQYLNIPFVDKGRDRKGLDCYGLVRLVYQEQRMLTLPSYTESYTTTADLEEIQALAQREFLARWRPIPHEDARVFDGLVLRIDGDPIHFGLVLDDQWFLHTMRDIWSKPDRWKSLGWKHRVAQVMRYVE